MAWSLNNYESYIYSIANLSSHIQASNLVLIRRGKFLADVEGNISFADDIVLEVYEHLNFVYDAFILMYGYVVKKGTNILYWYDSQPTPKIRIFNPRIRITNTFLLTLNTTEFPLPDFHWKSQTCLC
jgi:hypothetical protein